MHQSGLRHRSKPIIYGDLSKYWASRHSLHYDHNFRILQTFRFDIIVYDQIAVTVAVQWCSPYMVQTTTQVIFKDRHSSFHVANG